MTDKNENEAERELTAVEARGGRRVKGMPWVLGVSIAVAVVALVVIYTVFARPG